MATSSKKLSRFAPHVAAASLAAASVQGYMLIQAYRNNPKGTLIVPPGRTFGVELPSREQALNEAQQKIDAAIENTKFHLLRRMYTFDSLTLLRQSVRWPWSRVAPKEAVSVAAYQPKRIVVIGDSLACGVGSVNRWEHVVSAELGKNRAQESTAESHEGDGPVLPRMLASTLSSRLNCKVQWKSTGVVGGDIDDIRQQCMHLLEASGNDDDDAPPDIVVIICGMNDMKKLLSDPWQATSALTFRRKLVDLVLEVQRLAPGSKVVLPALPLVDDSSNHLNAFPLGLFLGNMVSFWDLQKQYVAAEMPHNVTYIERPTVEDIDRTGDVDQSAPSLTSDDGVHPSDHGYTLWAKFLGNTFMDRTGVPTGESVLKELQS